MSPSSQTNPEQDSIELPLSRLGLTADAIERMTTESPDIFYESMLRAVKNKDVYPLLKQQDVPAEDRLASVIAATIVKANGCSMPKDEAHWAGDYFHQLGRKHRAFTVFDDAARFCLESSNPNIRSVSDAPSDQTMMSDWISKELWDEATKIVQNEKGQVDEGTEPVEEYLTTALLSEIAQSSKDLRSLVSYRVRSNLYKMKHGRHFYSDILMALLSKEEIEMHASKVEDGLKQKWEYLDPDVRTQVIVQCENDMEII